MKNYTNIERIIAKIDNDFNPDNTDWIPRVGAWVIDAMNQLKVFNTERKRHKVSIFNRIGKSGCEPNTSTLVVYDENGCKVKEFKGDGKFNCSSPSTGCQPISEQTGFHLDNENIQPQVQVDIYTGELDYNKRLKSFQANLQSPVKEKQYIFDGCHTFEINWDTDYIIIEYDAIKTQQSKIYGVELPVIPNNGFLIEALAYYCIYKMLCRGYKHPVMNLAASQYGTNPYYMWTSMKEDARRGVILDAQGDIIEDNGLWASKLFIETFRPKD